MITLEPTIYAAKITYQIESMRLVNNNKKNDSEFFRFK